MSAKATEKAPAKDSKEPAKAKKTEKAFDPWSVLMYPHLAEKSVNMVETENKLVFIIRSKASKPDIKKAVETGFNVKVLSVNTEITARGQKKAYVKLSPESSAADVASRMGMI